MEKISQRKKHIIKHFDLIAPKRNIWIKKNSFFHKNDMDHMKFMIPSGSSILDLGCGNGSLLNSLNPSYGVGVDISKEMTDLATANYPNLNFFNGDVEKIADLKAIKAKFDYIILSDTLGYLEDCESLFQSLHSYCRPQTRIIVAYYSWRWEPILRLGEFLRLKMPSVEMNWLSTNDTINLLHLADFETIAVEWKQLIPKSFFGIGSIINSTLGILPFIRRLCLRNYLIARPLKENSLKNPSATVLIPCKNEEGNIENAIKRLPQFCNDLEIIFVEGGSSDNTREEIRRVIKHYNSIDIKFFSQSGSGKGNAVRTGFDQARGDVLIILDADLTVPPEDIPKFFDAVKNGKGEFINGTRLVYPLENEAMRFLNFWANRLFSVIFSWLLNQRYTDTLCGTKVLTKENYKKIIENRKYFGDFDPFGDFDLIFGASKLNLKTIEVPIRYASRKYGETQISRFKHGWLLIKMVIFAFRKLKIH